MVQGGAIKTIFAHSTANRYRFICVSVLSLALVFIDHRAQILEPIKFGLSFTTAPVNYLANAPQRLANWLAEELETNESLERKNKDLHVQNLLLQWRVQQQARLIAENTLLKELLNSAGVVDHRVIIGEIVGVDPDPYRHEVIVNKGTSDKLYNGQAVLDADGLMGQVIEVGRFTSRVLLISDVTHGVPISVSRNGVRAIVVGSGKLDLLKLIHVPDTADIVEGDLLLSSGLGERFPKGYPVGVISRVEHDPGQPFALVEASPKAKLDRTRYVLLVFDQAHGFGPDADELAADKTKEGAGS